MLEIFRQKWAAAGDEAAKKMFGGVTHQTPHPPPQWAHGSAAAGVNVPSNTERSMR